MEHYVYLRTIAEGSYGDVHACLRKDTGELCAVKRMKDAHIDGTSKRLALREAQIHRALPPHVNVTRLMDAFRGTSGRLYLVFDLANRSLLHEMRKHPRGVVPSGMAKVVAWQLLRALEHCHKQGVVHRDVKPANVLIGQPQADPAGRGPPSPAAAAGAAAAVHPGGQSCSSTPHGAGMVVKLCDFGLARYLPSKRSTTAAARPRRGGEAGPLDDRKQRLGGLTDYVVTRWYRAPEVIISCEPYDTAVDIWSFGCTLAELMSGTPLFPGSSSPDQLWRIMRCCGALADRHAAYLKFYPRLAALAETPAPGRTLAERVPAACPQMLDLINACLNMDPLKRPTATQLLQHPFFADVPRLLAADPELQQLLAAPQSKMPQPLVPSSAPVPPNDQQQPNSQQPPGVPVADVVTASMVAAPAPEPAMPAAAPAVRAAGDELAAAAAASPAETVHISSGNSCSSICIIEVGNMAATADTEAPRRRVMSLSALVITAATVAADAAEAVASASSGGCGVGCGETSTTVDTAGGASGTSSCMAMAWPHLLAARGAVTQPPHVIPVDLRVSYLDLDAAMPAAAAGMAYQQRLRDVRSEQLRPVAVEQGQRRHMSYPRLLPNALQQVYASASEAQQQDAVTVDAPATADTAAGGGGERCHGGYTRRHGVLSDAKSSPVSNQASTKASPAAAVAAAGSRAAALSPASLLPISRTLGVIGAASASLQCSWSHLRQGATPAGPPYCAAARQVDCRFPIGRGPRAPPADGCTLLRPPALTGRRRTPVITPLAVEAVDVYKEATAAAAISLQTSGDKLPSQVGAEGSRSLQDGGGSTWPFACSPAALYSSHNSAATAPGDAGDLYRFSSIGQGPTGAGAQSHRGPRRLLSAADLSSGVGVVQRSTRNSEATVLAEPALPCSGSGDGEPAVQQHPASHPRRQRPTLHAFVSVVQPSAADVDFDSDEPPEVTGVCCGNDHAAAPLVAAVSSMAAAGAVTETVPLPGGGRGFRGGTPQRPDSAAKTMDTHDGNIEVTVSVRLAAAILTAAASAASTFSRRGLTTGVSSAPLLAAGSSGGAAAVAAPEAAVGPSAAPTTAAAAAAAAGQAHSCSSATVAAAPEQQANTAARILMPPPATEDVYSYAYSPAADLLASVGATAACHGRLLDLELRSPFDLAEDTTTPRPPEPRHAALVVSNAVSVMSTARTTRAVTPVGSGCSGSILVASGYGGGGPVAGIIDINALFTTVGGNQQQTSNTCCTSVYSCATSAYVQGGGNGSATPCSSTAAAAAGPAGSFAAHSFSTVSAAAGAAVGTSTTAFGTAGAAAGRCSGGHRGVMTFLGSSHQGAEMEVPSGSTGVPLAPGASNPLASGAANRISGGGAATAVSAAALQLRNSAIGSSTAPDVDATSAAGAAAAEATSASEACSATASVGVRLEASTIVRSRVLERLLAQASSRLSCADKADSAGAADDSCARRDRRRSGSRDYSLSGSVSGLWWKGFALRPASLDVPEAQVLFAQQRQEQQSHDVQAAASRAAAGVSDHHNWNDVQAGRGQATRQLEAEGRATAGGRTAAVFTAENAAVAEAAKPSRWRTWLPSSCWRV